MRPVIKGEKVTLRPIRYTDTDLVVKWRNTERVWKNFIYRGLFTREIHLHWMDTVVCDGDVVQYIIEYDGEPVGSVYFRDIDRKNRNAEFGIFVGEDSAVGKGVGKEAAELFLDYGFMVLGLHRISLRVLPYNETAIRLYRKIGFQQEGVFRHLVYLDGAWQDVIFMAVINQDTDGNTV